MSAVRIKQGLRAFPRLAEGEEERPAHSSEEVYRRLNEIYREELERVRKEIANRGKSLQQFTIAVGTVGAIIFAGLVLVIEDPTAFQSPKSGIVLGEDFAGLISWLGSLCICSAFSVLCTAFTGSDIVAYNSFFGWFGYALGFLTLGGMAVSIPIILADISSEA